MDRRGRLKRYITQTDSEAAALALYTPDLNDKIVAYFDNRLYDRVTVYDYDRQGAVKGEREEEHVTPFPTLYGFAASIGVTTEVIALWRRHFPSFERAARLAEEMSKDRLIVAGMAGAYNASIVKLMLDGFATDDVKGTAEPIEVTIHIEGG